MRQDVEFMSEGTKVKGMFLTPDKGKGPFPTVVMAGGWCYVKELVQPSYAEAFTKAGMAALIKTLLMLRAGRLAPSLHFDAPNEHIDFSALPFEVVREARDWAAPADGEPRRAAISAFGFSGTNAHVVVEEGPAAFAPPVLPRPALAFFVSGHSEAALRRRCGDLADWLARGANVDLAAFSATLLLGREHYGHRAAVCGATREEIVEGLRAASEGRAGARVLLGGGAVKQEPALLELGRLLVERIQAPGLGAADYRDKLMALADLYTKGYALNFETLFAGERPGFVSLPPYPFDERRCWVEPADEGVDRRSAGTGLLGRVDAAASLGGGLVFRSEIPARHWVFADHRVRGRSILPASGLIAMALEAGRWLYGDAPIGIEYLRFVKPLEGESGASLVTELREDGALTVSSAAGPHLTCRLTGVGQDDGPSAEREELAASADRIDGPAFYARCAEAGLVFGPRFRRLREVSGDGTVAVGRIEGAVQGFDAGWLDAVLQTVGGREAGTSLNAGRAVMPVAADRIECFAALPVEAEALARLGADGRFAIDVTDKDGGLVLRIAGLAFVELAAPAQAVADTDALDIYLPRWKLEAAPAEIAPEKVVVLGGAGTPDLVRSLLRLHPGAQSLVLDGDPGAADLVYWFGALEVAVGDSLSTPSEVVLAEERVLLPLLRRLKSLVGKPGHLKVVADRGHDFASGDTVRPVGAAVLGLAKAAAREAAPLRVSAIDVDLRDDPDEIARGLAGEPGHGGGEDIALRRGLRWRRILEWAALEHGELRLREGGCYVILGGAGGLGRVLSRHLAERWGARLVWLGRRAEDEDIRAALAEVRVAGGEAIYLSADAGDAEALRAALAEARDRFGNIHGVVHSALVLRDSLVAGMGEADLLEVLAPKTRGIAALVEALGDAQLDFLCLFSSAISFSGNAGQANYAAASQFIDAYAAGLRAAVAYPVVTIDWGYWGETGIVADEATRRRMSAQGVLSIEAGAGMDAFERLLASGIGQAMPIRLTPEKRAAMADPATVRCRTESALPARLPRASEAAEKNEAKSGQAYEDLDRYARRRLAEVLSFALPEPGEAAVLDDIRARLSLAPRQEPIFAALIEMLVREGILRADGEIVEAVRYPLAERPEAAAVRDHLALLDQCLDGLGDLLAGRCGATQLLFPGGDRDKVQAVYRGNATMAACDAMLGELAADFLAAHAGADPAQQFRILEIGGGTGAATRHVLAALAGLAGRIEYDFTDVSRSFANQAEAGFGGAYPFVRFGALDIASPPGGQGFGTGGYDLVIASNVLHAVGDLSAALGHAKSLLKRGGLLLVNEVTARFDAVTLTFGLTPEWWSHGGGDRRLPHAPLLSVPLWRDRLAAEGFDPLAVHSPGAANTESGGQAIFAALGDGWMRLPVATAPRPVVAGKSDGAASPATADTDRTLAVLHQVFGKVLGMTAVELDVEATFETFGVDSLVVMDINRALEAYFGPVPATILYEARTLRALAGRLAEVLPEAPVMAVASAAAHAESPAHPESPGPEGVNRPPSSSGDEPIAIIGMACRFPGAVDPEQFWDLLREGRSAIGEVPVSRWDWRETAGGMRGEVGRHYTRYGGFIADADKFDPLFFGIAPQEAETLDPQERLFLETAWHALEDAGYPAPVCKGQAVGVYVGVMNAGYEWLSGRASAQGHGGDAHSAYWSVANRVTYCFDFTGPSMAVDTACSSSLTALHLACDALRRGDCETAIAGGVNVIAGPVHYTRLCNLGMVSEGPDCKSFGDEADGFVDGEGVGAVLLKPLSRALADGDFIHGVLRGSAINAGGKTGGYTVPNPRAQAQVVARALDRAGLSARDISYVEAHGTGTALGDPIEIAGLKEAFAADTRDVGFCAVGSVKSNIGHLESAAGIAGLIKLLLMLRHRALAHSLHAERPNPNLGMEGSPFRLQRRFEDWPAEGPRRAGLSSFGAGGANAHVVIEEAPARPAVAASGRSELIVLSADDDARLRVQAAALRAAITPEVSGAPLDLAALVGEVLGIDGAAIDGQTPLRDVGLDGAGVTRLAALARERVGHELTVEPEDSLDGLRMWADPSPVALDSLAFTLQTGRASLESRFAAFVSGLPDLVIALDAFLDGQPVAAIERGDEMAQAGRRFLAGETVDFRVLWPQPHPARAMLPPYEFRRERYWIPELDGQADVVAFAETARPTAPSALRFPLGTGGARVAVVGGGPAGLVAAKSLLEEGHKPVLFERTDRIGGI